LAGLAVAVGLAAGAAWWLGAGPQRGGVPAGRLRLAVLAVVGGERPLLAVVGSGGATRAAAVTLPPEAVERVRLQHRVVVHADPEHVGRRRPQHGPGSRDASANVASPQSGTTIAPGGSGCGSLRGPPAASPPG